MAWLWSDYNPETVYAVQTRPFSSKIESTGDVDAEGRSLINPLCRFHSIFRPLRDYSENENIPLEHMENLFFHLLAAFDDLSGLHLTDLEMSAIQGRIIAGEYGHKAAENFSLLSKSERWALLWLLRKQERCNRLFYPEAFHALYPGGCIYHYKDDDNLLLYIPREESEAGKRKMRLLEDLFDRFPCIPKRYYWNRHFGIIGLDQTMRQGHMVIYSTRGE